LICVCGSFDTGHEKPKVEKKMMTIRDVRKPSERGCNETQGVSCDTGGLTTLSKGEGTWAAANPGGLVVLTAERFRGSYLCGL